MGKKFYSFSVGKKILLALSGIFLMLFIIVHVTINFISLLSIDTFNELSHFMGTNVIVQFLIQPILIFAIFYHYIAALIIEINNKKATQIKYVVNNTSVNSSWVSRNMIVSGVVLMAFLVGHLINFWLPEMMTKYVEFAPEDPNRYWHELHQKFQVLPLIIVHLIGFIALCLHLLHGFQSSMTTMGIQNSKNKEMIMFCGKSFAIIIPLLFAIIAFSHFFIIK